MGPEEKPGDGKQGGRPAAQRVYRIHLRALEAKNSLAGTRIAPTADAIMRIISGLSPEKRMLLETFRGYIEMRQGLAGSAFSENTVKRYVSTLNHLRAFVRLEYGGKTTS